MQTAPLTVTREAINCSLNECIRKSKQMTEDDIMQYLEYYRSIGGIKSMEIVL